MGKSDKKSKKKEEPKEEPKKKGFGEQKVKVSKEFAAVLGKRILKRKYIQKRMWVFIKENKLQSKTSGRIIECKKNKIFSKVFGKNDVDMMKLAGLYTPHVKKYEEKSEE